MPRFSSSCLVLIALFTSTAFGELIHQYTFNDGTANDSVGGAHGIAVHDPLFQNGQVIFDPSINDGTNSDPATGQYIDLPNGIAAHRALTIEVWTTFRGGNRWQRMVDFGNCTAGELLPWNAFPKNYDGTEFLILTPTDNQDHPLGQISIAGAGTDYSVSNTDMTLNEEHHVVLTHDPDLGLQFLYLDGQQVGVTSADVDPSTSTWVNYFIGRANFSTNAFYNGSFNEVRIYDHALSALDVHNNYVAGPQAIPEPTTLAMICGALASFVAITAHRRRSQGRDPTSV